MNKMNSSLNHHYFHLVQSMHRTPLNQTLYWMETTRRRRSSFSMKHADVPARV
jgi:hypothetical protein